MYDLCHVAVVRIGDKGSFFACNPISLESESLNSGTNGEGNL